MATATVTPEITVNNTPAEINAAIVAATPTVTPAVETPAVPTVETTPPPFTVTQDGGKFKAQLATGEVFEGASDREVLDKVLASKVNTTLWAKGKAQLPDDDTLRALRPDLFVAPTAVAPKVETAATVDPAQDFLMDTVAKGLGLKDANELKAFVGGIRQSDAQQQTNRVVLDFQRQAPDFPNTNEAFDKLGKFMDEAGIPLTAKGMVAAHLACKATNVYQPLTPEQVKATTTGVVRTAVPVATPVVTSSAPSTGADDPMTYDINTPMEKINAAIAAAKAQR